MKQRCISLDVLRGITVMLMIMANNPGNWSVNYHFMCHSHWNGCTLTDLIFPTFLFCAGAAMAFSLDRFEGLTRAALWKVLKRTALVFLVGLAINMFPFYPTDWNHDLGFWQNYGLWLKDVRIFGVLQRIALGYGLAAILVLWLRKPGKVAVAGIVLAALYSAILLIFGDLSLEGNFSGKFDIALLGENHVYHGYGIPFDPEGLLGTMTGACTAMLGWFSAYLVKNDPEAKLKLFAYGLLALLLSQFVSIIIPINKPLWSASYVLYAGGWAMLAFGLLNYIEYKGRIGLFEPWRAFGCNALTMFVLSCLISRSIFTYTSFTPSSICHTSFASLLYSFCYAAVLWVLAWVLYKKKVFIKL